MGTGPGENGGCQRHVHVSSEELISPTCLFGRLLWNLSLRARHCPPCKDVARPPRGPCKEAAHTHFTGEAQR